jgi:signal transduction histidine kinase
VRSPLGYDLTAIKWTDSFRNREVQVRTLALGAVALILTALLQDLTYLIWYATYMLLFGVYSLILERAPQRVSRTRYMMIAFLGHLSFAGLLTICLYLYAGEMAQLHYGALILYFCIAMNTLALRIRDPYLYLADVSALFVTAAGFIGIEIWRSGASQQTYLIILGFVGFSLYFAYLVFEQNRVRKSREAARFRQIAAEHERAIGQISGGVAHDFNNLLTVILGNLELSGQMRNDADRAQLLTEAEAAAQRGARLTRQLLAFSRKAPLKPAPVTLEALHAELAPLAAQMLGRRHRLQIGEAAGVPALYADSTTLLAVLLNLILNAKEAMPQGGTIWLDAEAAERGGREMVCLRVNDTGAGIADEIAGQVFEPFFSTKPPGQGSGLGLPMALGFAEQSGGDIEVTSVPGEGTEVALYLPRAERAQTAERASMEGATATA